ncbi:Outer membrane stress sensor protease DegS [hydrothermal vent metagenome]|uniref:Outer membrane stress sensor protease DegS n=1 Tax=hydrothermal vent metagenome TaxID=652676 RepID=A0A3B0T797_9ZZZZ
MVAYQKRRNSVFAYWAPRVGGIALLVALVLVAFSFASNRGADPAQAQPDIQEMVPVQAPRPVQTQIQAQVPVNAGQIKLSFAPVVARAAPAVVNVYSKQIVRQRSRSPIFNDPFFQRFFGQGFGVPRERVRSSLGSGAIVSSDGIVITNNHVIKGGSEIRVVLADKREFEAQVLAKDERTDLAVLKIMDGGEAFPFLEFADSDQVEIGDLVLAVGNPFGIGQTVTSGIVSALARTQVGISDYRFFIQTDAAINPGNSGGPLIDMGGRVIGINTAIYSRSGGSNGIGFAIPSNMAKIVTETASTGKRLRRPWLGARFQALNADIAASLGLDRPAGALVTEVFPDAPLALAGLRPGDVIVGVEEFGIDDPQGLEYRLTTRGLGAKVSLAYLRDGKRRQTQLVLEAAPEDPPRDQTTLRGRHGLAGAQIANLSPAVAEDLDLALTSREPAVVITGLAERSPAARVGLEVGDLILGIDGRATTSVAELEAALARVGEVFELAIRRGRRVITTRLRG